jgi:hypothetical protein
VSGLLDRVKLVTLTVVCGQKQPFDAGIVRAQPLQQTGFSVSISGNGTRAAPSLTIVYPLYIRLATPTPGALIFVPDSSRSV